MFESPEGMPEVSVDGEEVLFEGEAPQDIGQIFDLLMGAMSEKGRAVISFVVDGSDMMAKPEDQPLPTTFEKIEAVTMTHSELTLQLVMRVEEETESLDDELTAYSRKILLLGWTEIFQRMDEFISKIKPIAELLDNLDPFAKTYDPPWRSDFEGLQKRQAEALHEVLSSFQTGDVAELSNVVKAKLLPILEEFRKLSSLSMKPYLLQNMEEAG